MSELLHLHTASACGTATVVFKLTILFHNRKVTMYARDGNASPCYDVTHRERFTVASVYSLMKTRMICFFESVVLLIAPPWNKSFHSTLYYIFSLKMVYLVINIFLLLCLVIIIDCESIISPQYYNHNYQAKHFNAECDE